jgi:hypothetical protein
MNADVAERLGRYLDASAPAITVDEILRGADGATATASGAVPPSADFVAPRAPHRRGPVRAAAAVLVVAVGAALLVLARHEDDDATDDAPAHQVETVDEEDAPVPDPTLLDRLLHDDEWRELPVPPIGPREDPISLWTGTAWFVWGGQAAIGGQALADGALFDPDANEWRAIPDAPVPWRESARAVVGDGEVVVMSRDEGSAAVERFDLESEEWEVVDNPRLTDQLQPLATFDLHAYDRGYVVVGVPFEMTSRHEAAPPEGAPMVVLRVSGGLDDVEAIAGAPTAVPSAAVASGVVDDDLVVWRVQLETRGNSTDGPHKAGAVLDLARGAWRSISENVDFPFAGGSAAVLANQLVAWGRESGPGEICVIGASCPSTGNPPEPSLGATFDPQGDRVVDMAPGPADPGGGSAISTGDYLIARSEGYTGGLGDAENPPAYVPGEWGLYDPAANEWHHLSGGGRRVPGERGDIAPAVFSDAALDAGWGEPGVIASAWTGDELLTWTFVQIPGGRREHQLAAYGPRPDRSVLDLCVSGPDGPLPVEAWGVGEGPFSFPRDGDGNPRELKWTRVGSEPLGGGEAFALMIPGFNTIGRPGYGLEVVGADCELRGYWIVGEHGTMDQATPGEYADLDFRWYAYEGAIDHPTAGQVVTGVRPPGGSGADWRVFVVADSDAFPGESRAATGYPAWRPADDAEDGPTQVRGGTITGGDADAGGAWADMAQLGVGERIELTPPETTPTPPTYEVTEVHQVPDGDVDGVDRTSDDDLRLVIRHTDESATVIDLRRI